MDRLASVDGTPQTTSGYGRSEIKRFLHRNFTIGLTISTAIHLFIVSAYYAREKFGRDSDDIPVVAVKIMKYSDLGPPPSISAAPPPAIGIQSAIKPSIGVPVPVPDLEVSPENTIATQQELSSTPSPALEDLGQGAEFQVTQDIAIEEEDPGMDVFIPVEKNPMIIKQEVPDYPELALRAGLEGKVWVKILVDKEGKPLKAIVIRSTSDVFDSSAVRAAMRFLFTPAVNNRGPVKVWVSIPFKFTLSNGSSN